MEKLSAVMNRVYFISVPIEDYENYTEQWLKDFNNCQCNIITISHDSLCAVNPSKSAYLVEVIGKKINKTFNSNKIWVSSQHIHRQWRA